MNKRSIDKMCSQRWQATASCIKRILQAACLATMTVIASPLSSFADKSIHLKAPYSGETFTYTEMVQDQGRKGYSITDSSGRVVEYSPDYVLSDLLGERIKRVAGNALGKGRSLADEEYLYAGPGMVLTRCKIMDAKGICTGTITIDARTLQIVDGSMVKGNNVLVSAAPAAEETERSIKGIPAVTYCITEGATATAAIVRYLEDKNAPGLTGGKSDRDLAISLAGAGCGCNLGKLLQEYAAKQRYTLETKEYAQPAQIGKELFTFASLQKEIDEGHPGIAVITSSGLKRILTLIGYKKNASGEYIIAAEQGCREESSPQERKLYLNLNGNYEKLEYTSITRITKASEQ